MTPSAEASNLAADGWWSRVWQRVCYQSWLKGIGTTAFMYLFFRAYFMLLENPRTAPTVMPEIWLDHWVDFTPSAFPVYLSLWVYVSLAPTLIGNLRALIWFGVWVGALCLTGLFLFWAWPTQTPSFAVDWGLYPGLALIKGVDAAGNACPSLHVASAVFSACWLHRILRQLRSPAWLLWLSALHCVAIAWSTMATLQHVALDVFGGAALGLLFSAASLAHIRKTD
jgi:hypothetical protein